MKSPSISQVSVSHHKYAERLYPCWLWGVCKQLSQTIEEIHDVDTVAVVKQSTVQCWGGGGGWGCRADHAQSITANSFYKQTCQYSCSMTLMSHNMNLLSSHFTISYTLHSCETVNKKVNCGLTPNKNGNCGIFFLFILIVKVNEYHAIMPKMMSYLVVGVVYIHKEPPVHVFCNHLLYSQLFHTENCNNVFTWCYNTPV